MLLFIDLALKLRWGAIYKPRAPDLIGSQMHLDGVSTRLQARIEIWSFTH